MGPGLLRSRPFPGSRVLPLLFLLLAALLFGSCGGGEDRAAAGGARVDTLAGGGLHVRNLARGAWELDEAEAWRVVEELRIGMLDGEAPYVFGSARNVIPDAQGRIWVMDSQAFELRLFDADGRFVRAVGRRGDGPGEFSGNPCAFPGPDGEIWVEDSLRRWHRFDTAGVYVGGHRTTSNLGCGIRRWTPDGRFLVVNTVRDRETLLSTGYYVVHRLDAGGELVQGDTILAPELAPSPRVTWVWADGRVGSIVTTVPFWPSARQVLSSAGDFWIAEGGGPYLIRRQTLEGDTSLVVERAYEPIPIPDSIRDRAIREFRREGMTAEGGFDPDQVPRVFPPFDQLLISTDGTLWVRRPLADGAIGLDVFSAEGRYLGEARTPVDFDRMSILHVTPDKMYGVVRDELGVPYVVRLGVRRPGG